MITIYYLNNNGTGSPVCPLVITLGNFDGVHIGHQALLKTAVNESAADNICSAVWSLKYNPAEYPVSYLTDIREKISLFESAGIDMAVFDDFDAVKDYSPERFVDEILIGRFNCVTAVCGFNYHFGKNGAGTAETLNRLMTERGRKCIIVNPVMYSGETVSSSRIRSHITNGDMEYVQALLGRPFSIKLTVISGNRIGRTIGMPTINQIFPDRHIVPANGVYCTRCEIDGKVYNSVTNIGTRPTVTDSDIHIICETHIIGYDGDLYGREIKVSFYKKIRDEKKFVSLDELKQTITANIKEAEHYFENI